MSGYERRNGKQRVGQSRQWVNRFEITNREDLALGYRLLEIRGLPACDQYDKLVNKLAKQVRRELRQPVALVRRGESHCLAVLADAPMPNPQQRLTPHVASLIPLGETRSLELARLDASTTPIALSFLQFAFSAPLYLDR